MTFEDYLLTYYNKSQRTYNEKLSFHHSNIKILKNFGVDIDNFYKDPSKVAEAITILTIELKQFAQKDQKARLDVFKLYYKYLITQNHVIAFGSQQVPHTQRIKRRYQASPLNPPIMGPDTNLGRISYEDYIPYDQKVPGLTEFLCFEYELIVDWLAGHLFNKEGELYEIPVILSDETPIEFEPYSDEKYADLILNLNKKTNGQFSRDEVLAILRDGFKDRIGGEYFINLQRERDIPEGPYIKLYYRNIKYKSRKEYFYSLAATLAHEYLHFLHHMEIGDKEFMRNDDVAKRVQESLADFFSLLYLVNPCPKELLLRADIAKKTNKEWERRYPFNWPYAYALHYYKNYNKFSINLDDYRPNAVGKFLEVFGITNLDQAYQLLIK